MQTNNKRQHFRYSPSKLDPQRWNVETNRDVILNMFSDARTLAPVIRFANYQSKANRQSYFYVFGHNSISSDYAAVSKTVVTKIQKQLNYFKEYVKPLAVAVIL